MLFILIVAIIFLINFLRLCFIDPYNFPEAWEIGAFVGFITSLAISIFLRRKISRKQSELKLGELLVVAMIFATLCGWAGYASKYTVYSHRISAITASLIMLIGSSAIFIYNYVCYLSDTEHESYDFLEAYLRPSLIQCLYLLIPASFLWVSLRFLPGYLIPTRVAIAVLFTIGAVITVALVAVPICSLYIVKCKNEDRANGALEYEIDCIYSKSWIRKFKMKKTALAVLICLLPLVLIEISLCNYIYNEYLLESCYSISFDENYDSYIDTDAIIESDEDINIDSNQDSAKAYEPDYYVLNMNSKKIHTPQCAIGKKIDFQNRRLTSQYYTLSDALDDGYTYCGHCLD